MYIERPLYPMDTLDAMDALCPYKGISKNIELTNCSVQWTQWTFIVSIGHVHLSIAHQWTQWTIHNDIQWTFIVSIDTMDAIHIPTEPFTLRALTYL